MNLHCAPTAASYTVVFSQCNGVRDCYFRSRRYFDVLLLFHCVVIVIVYRGQLVSILYEPVTYIDFYRPSFETIGPEKYGSGLPAVTCMRRVL